MSYIVLAVTSNLDVVEDVKTIQGIMSLFATPEVYCDYRWYDNYEQIKSNDPDIMAITSYLDYLKADNSFNYSAIPDVFTLKLNVDEGHTCQIVEHFEMRPKYKYHNHNDNIQTETKE